MLWMFAGNAMADTIIGNSGTYTINISNAITKGTFTVWTYTGTLTMSNGATLLVTPSQHPPTNPGRRRAEDVGGRIQSAGGIKA